VFEGRVAEITPRGDPVARSYRVRISFVGDVPLQIGMSAETNIVIAQRRECAARARQRGHRHAVWRVER
jgi:multidrug efflux system membrane fusion protein